MNRNIVKKISVVIAAFMCVMMLVPSMGAFAADTAPRLTVQKNSLNEVPLEINKEYDMVLTIANTSTMDAANAKLLLKGFSPNEVQLLSAADSASLGTIKAGESATATFKVKFAIYAPKTMSITAELTADGMTKIEVPVSFTIFEGEELPPATSGEVVTSPPPVEENYPPIRMSLDSYSVSPEKLLAGDTFTFKFTIKNNSSYFNANSVKVYITDDAGVMLPTGLTNYVNLYSIAKTGTASGSIDLEISKDAPTKIYNLNLRIDYIDNKGNAQSTTETAAVRIDSTKKDPEEVVDNVVIKDVSLSSNDIKAGDNFDLKAVIANNGKTAITGLEVNLTGLVSGEITPTTLNTIDKVNSLKAGGSNTTTFKLNASDKMETGVYQIVLTVKYTNAAKQDAYMSHTVYIRVTKDVEGPTKLPSLTLKRAGVTGGSAKAGSDTILSIEMNNAGLGDARNVRFTLVGMNESVSLKGYTDLITKDVVQSNKSVSIEYPLRIDKSSGKSIALVLNVAYLDQNDKEITGTFNIYIPVIVEEPTTEPDESKTPTPRLLLESFQLSQSSVIYGSTFSFSYKIKNLSQLLDVKDLRITVEGDGNFTPTNGINTFVEAALGKGKSFSKTMQMQANAKIMTGTYPISITVSYIDELGRECTEMLKAYIRAIGEPDPENDPEKPEEKRSIPRVLLSTYSLDVPDVNAGKDFTFSFVLFNSSKLTAISNMKVTVSSAEGIFTPVEGSNSFYTEIIDIGNSQEFSIKLNAKGGAEQKSYPIDVSYSYEDEKGNPYDENVKISIYITQPTRFELSNFFAPPSSMAYSPFNISLQYFNKGLIPLNNFTISMEGDFSLMDGEIYVGNFPSNSSDYLDLMVMPNGVGQQKGVLVFSYEDAVGNPKRYEQEFEMDVMEMGEDAFMPYPPEGGFPIEEMPGEVEKGFDWIFWGAVAGSGLLVIIVVIVIIVIVVKKKKKSVEEEW